MTKTWRNELGHTEDTKPFYLLLQYMEDKSSASTGFIDDNNIKAEHIKSNLKIGFVIQVQK